MKFLFEPQSVAIIGASHSKGKIGHTMVHNIISGGYQGEVYPVNPRGGEILGKKVFASIGDIPGTIDLATITVPAKYVLSAVEECAAQGVKFIQIITSGFSEVGNSEEEQRIVNTARQGGMRILGPNIFGLFAASSSLNATFSASTVKSGHVAILTQSGALGIAMIGKTAVDNMGLSAIVSTGNKCDIDESDLLNYLVPHQDTKVILMYIEGVKNGSRLIETLKWASRKKPIIVIKSGRSKRGALAAASHTGSLAGSDEIFEAIMRQCGVLRAETIEEAFNWCKFLAYSPLPNGDKTVIVTNGGGVGVLATDASEKFDIQLYDNQEVLRDVFAAATPSYGSTKNPIDITGGATSDNYIAALTAPAKSQHIDSTIALYCETSTFDSDNLESMIKDTYQQHISAGKPISYAIVGGEEVESAMVNLKRANIPVFADVYDSVSVLGVAYRYQRYLSEGEVKGEEAEIDLAAINQVVNNALKDGRNFLLSHEGAAVMKAAGIKMPKSRVAKNIEEAIEFAEEIGYPLVAKVVSRHILHCAQSPQQKRGYGCL